MSIFERWITQEYFDVNPLFNFIKNSVIKTSETKPQSPYCAKLHCRLHPHKKYDLILVTLSIMDVNHLKGMISNQIAPLTNFGLIKPPTVFLPNPLRSHETTEGAMQAKQGPFTRSTNVWMGRLYHSESS
jgi:hypothetical protein